MDRIAFTLILIPPVLIGLLIYLGIGRVTRRRRLRRIAEYAHGDFAFTFASNGWYQAALQELRDQGMIDPAVGDDPGPLGGGPFWASASGTAFTIWRGYDLQPLIAIPWSSIDLVTTAIPLKGNTRYRGETGVDIRVRGPKHSVQLLMFSANASGRVIDNARSAREVADELNRLRGAPVPQ